MHRHRWHRVVRILSSVAVLAALTAGVPSVARAADLSGQWKGNWRSCVTGHNGPLRATFTKCGPDKYRVRFAGRFAKLIPFRYSVTLNVVEEGEVVKLRGSSYLGRLVGTFCYNATATGCRFQANYSSPDDRGLFTLRKI